MEFIKINLTDVSENTQGNGWLISHKENGSQFSSIKCKVDEQEVYVPASKLLIDALDDGKVTSADGIGVVPLCNKSIVDVKNPKFKNQAFAFYIEAEEAQKICAIKLDGCASIIAKIAEDKSKVALVVVTIKPDYAVRIYQENKKLVIFNRTGITHSVVNHDVPVPESLRIKRLVVLPKKAFITKFRKGERVIAPEGFVAVSIAQLLSKNSLVIAVPQEVQYDTNLLSVDDVSEASAFISNLTHKK